MTGLVILSAWSAIGAALAVKMRRPNTSPASWIPVAVFLGPLWASVAADQRRSHR